MKNLIILLVVILTFSSCKDLKEGYKDGYSDAKKEAGFKKKKGVKLYALNGGSVKVNMLEIFSQDTTYSRKTKEFADDFNRLPKYPKYLD